MKRTLTTILSLSILLSLSSSVFAASVKKNPPKNSSEIDKHLKKAGEQHSPAKLKVSKVGPVEAGDTYYHIYNGSLKSGGYRIIIFNNVPEYLGYYPSEFEATDFEEGAVLLDSGDSDEDGNTTYFTVPIGAAGPAEKIRIDGTQVMFVKAPGVEDKTKSGIGQTAGTVAAPSAPNGKDALEYRDWKITIQGQERTFNAIFVKIEKGEVTIKDSKLGREATVPVSALSEEDVEYLKKITSKE